jgi:hypothetical protein
VNIEDPVLRKERRQERYRAPEVSILGDAVGTIMSRTNPKATGPTEFVTGGHVVPAYDLDE